MKKKLMIILVLVSTLFIGCGITKINDADKTRIEEIYTNIVNKQGCSVLSEVSTFRDPQGSASSLSKHQYYKLICSNNTQDAFYLVNYSKYENSKRGRSEVKALYEKNKASYVEVPNSSVSETNENDNSLYFTMNADFSSKAITTVKNESTETIIESSENESDSRVKVIMIYDEEKNELYIISGQGTFTDDSYDNFSNDILKVIE